MLKLLIKIFLCTSITLAVNIDFFEGDSQELLLDYILETCMEQLPKHTDPSFLNIQNALKNLTSGKEMFDEFCWEGVTAEYDVTHINCFNNITSEDLEKLDAIFENGYSDGTVIVLNSCESSKALKNIISRRWPNKSGIIFVLPTKCEETGLQIELESSPSIESMYVNKGLAKKEIITSTILTSAEESQEKFMTIIYDETYDQETKDVLHLTKVLHDRGVELQLLEYNKYLSLGKGFYKKWIFPVSSATIVVMTEQSKIENILQRAISNNAMTLKKLSWIIYNPENVERVQRKIADVIRYDMRILIIKNTNFQESMNVSMLTLQVLQKRFGIFGMSSNECLPCTEDRVVRGRSLRVVYSPIPGVNSRLECTALWDLSMAMKSFVEQRSVWGPKYPKMLGITLKLSVIHSPPFIIKEMGKNGTTFKGFLIDILKTINSHLKFKYKFIEPKDNAYGILNDNTFGGIVGQVQKRESDIGLGQISYLIERMNVVDYLSSYIGYKGVKMMYKNPEIDKLNFNTDWISSFTDPFQTTVWMFIVLTVVAAAVSMTTCECLQSNDKLHLKMNPRIREFKNPFNNLFYMYSAILNQGWDMTPEAISSRVVVICFRLFCVFMYAGYSAVIVSQNVVARDIAQFSSLEQVISQGNYKLGTVKNTNFERILRTADQGLYKETWKYILKHPNNMVSTAREGFNKAKKEKYIFMIDEDEADYELIQSCTFKAPDETPMQGVNTFIVSKNSQYKDALSSQLTTMHETGLIQRLRMKWWKSPKVDRCNYLREGKGGAITQTGLTLSMLKMPFILMLAGIGASFVFLCFEYQTKKVCPGLLDIST